MLSALGGRQLLRCDDDTSHVKLVGTEKTLKIPLEAYVHHCGSNGWKSNGNSGGKQPRERVNEGLAKHAEQCPTRKDLVKMT
ncbi:unnamed protein product [Heligmosomoides polygyrus]|uniref:Netrin-1 n=1 Tax=Heligmosomoides polygyrus TaxID=6339 RepID=A0A183GBK7_HELPZ|nr:unnamed protein product [Heligmosomoides polygyrus]